MQNDVQGSVSTSASVRRLNDAISDLGFYMQAEVQHIESTAKEVAKLCANIYACARSARSCAAYVGVCDLFFM